jgi:hypothetical protein
MSDLGNDRINVIGLILLTFTFAWCAQGCQSLEPKQSENPLTSDETPDQVFCREWDACWAIYTDCQKTKTKDECFPAMEKCGIAAYRKLKKARTGN